jgi:predicted phage tail protein
MMRNIYFEGELGEKFIPHMKLNCSNVAEVFRCIDANFPDYKSYMLKKHEEGVAYHIEIAGNELEDPAELLLDIKEGDIIVTPVAAGSKSGPLKILAAIALIVVTGGAAAVYAAGGGAFTAGGLTALGGGMGAIQGGLALALSGGLGATAQLLTLGALSMATNLAMAGVNQMMAPDPSTDSDQEQSYLFNGAEQNIIEGDPVPVLYGRLRVPGQPVSFEVAGARLAAGPLGGIGIGGGEGGGGAGPGGGGGTDPGIYLQVPDAPDWYNVPPSPKDV